MEDSKKPLLALDGSTLPLDLFNQLFNETHTYAVLPLMLERAAFDVARSDFDCLKEHSLGYHISGLVDVVLGVKKALKQLQDEAIILEADMECEIDQEQYQRYLTLKKFLETFE